MIVQVSSRLRSGCLSDDELEKAILGLMADSDMRSRLKEKAPDMALGPESRSRQKPFSSS
jgi:hypothetical protein